MSEHAKRLQKKPKRKINGAQRAMRTKTARVNRKPKKLKPRITLKGAVIEFTQCKRASALPLEKQTGSVWDTWWRPVIPDGYPVCVEESVQDAITGDVKQLTLTFKSGPVARKAFNEIVASLDSDGAALGIDDIDGDLEIHGGMFDDMTLTMNREFDG